MLVTNLDTVHLTNYSVINLMNNFFRLIKVNPQSPHTPGKESLIITKTN
jgi:hypothetical protein